LVVREPVCWVEKAPGEADREPAEAPAGSVEFSLVTQGSVEQRAERQVVLQSMDAAGEEAFAVRQPEAGPADADFLAREHD
jgi:hypothetical protein